MDYILCTLKWTAFTEIAEIYDSISKSRNPRLSTWIILLRKTKHGYAQVRQCSSGIDLFSQISTEVRNRLYS